jgi:hypothetical protein
MFEFYKYFIVYLFIYFLVYSYVYTIFGSFLPLPLIPSLSPHPLPLPSYPLTSRQRLEFISKFSEERVQTIIRRTKSFC